ncbi:DNA-binding response regulator [Streptomyces albospinus]|uniref:DNA-binding response regulator n=1 Tax=Streptomyces albospinus TaxID=285515 RepID=A0ABQ2UNT2_9ACTN|nr:response regulator transcription factor [Streptomyces albospinus]GGU44338.1 DNA-binding response regulator [Streptomyces albospinus]
MAIRGIDHVPQRRKHDIKRIIVLDRNELSRAGFTSLIAGELDIRATEADFSRMGVEAAIRQTDPDLIIIACDDRVLDKVERVVSTATPTPIAAFAHHWDREDAISALRLGVRGLGVKSQSKDTIIAAIHTVAAGGTYLSPCVADCIIDAALDRMTSPDAEALAKIAALTDQERRVLTFLANGMTTAEIAGEITVSSATVKSHISHILRKLELQDRVQAVVFAYKSGFAVKEACLTGLRDR